MAPTVAKSVSSKEFQCSASMPSVVWENDNEPIKEESFRDEDGSCQQLEEKLQNPYNQSFLLSDVEKKGDYVLKNPVIRQVFVRYLFSGS